MTLDRSIARLGPLSSTRALKNPTYSNLVLKIGVAILKNVICFVCAHTETGKHLEVDKLMCKSVSRIDLKHIVPIHGHLAEKSSETIAGRNRIVSEQRVLREYCITQASDDRSTF